MQWPIYYHHHAPESLFHNLIINIILYKTRVTAKRSSIDIAFHNVLILAFWRYFSESDTDVDHPLPVSYVIQQQTRLREHLYEQKSVSRHSNPLAFSLNLQFFSDFLFVYSRNSS
jgi:hypothetical protein